MKRTIEETDRRRAKQMACNKEHGITPTPIVKTQKTNLSKFTGASPSKSDRLKSSRLHPKYSLRHRSTSVTAKPRPYIEEEHVAGLWRTRWLEYMTPEDCRPHRAREIRHGGSRDGTEFIVAAQLRDELSSFQDIYDSGIKGSRQLWLPTSKDEMEGSAGNRPT